MVLEVVASSGKKCTYEWISADTYIKTWATMNKKDLMMQIMCGRKMQHLVIWQRNMGVPQGEHAQLLM